MSNASQFFSSGGNSVAPVFRRKRALVNRSGGYFPDGFASNGDYVRLPTNSSSSLIYYNASNTTVWTKTPDNLFAGSNTMVTFAMGNNGLLYCVTSPSGTGAVRLSSVNAAGTVVQIGAGFVPSPALVTSDAWAPFASQSAAGAQIVGNALNVYFTNREISINLTTGALISDTVIRCAKGSAKLGAYLFAVTAALGTFSGINAYARLRKNTGTLSAVADIALHGDTGASTTGAQPGVTAAILSWKTELVQISGCASDIDGSLGQGDYTIVFDQATLSSDVATLAKNLKFDV